MANWYLKGNSGVKEAKELEKIRSLKAQNTAKRFFIPSGKEAKLIFVDDEGFYCSIHQFQFNGKWNNFATCTKEMGGCPICDDGKFSIWVAHYTVIDTTKFEYNGKTYQNRKLLLPAKNDALQMIADLKEQYGSLVGRVFLFKRYKDKSVNTGIPIKYLGKVKNISKNYGKESDVPFDYEKVLAPLSNEEYKTFGFINKAMGATELDEPDIEFDTEEDTKNSDSSTGKLEFDSDSETEDKIEKGTEDKEEASFFKPVSEEKDDIPF